MTAQMEFVCEFIFAKNIYNPMSLVDALNILEEKKVAFASVNNVFTVLLVKE